MSKKSLDEDSDVSRSLSLRSLTRSLSRKGKNGTSSKRTSFESTTSSNSKSSARPNSRPSSRPGSRPNSEYEPKLKQKPHPKGTASKSVPELLPEDSGKPLESSSKVENFTTLEPVISDQVAQREEGLLLKNITTPNPLAPVTNEVSVEDVPDEITPEEANNAEEELATDPENTNLIQQEEQLIQQEDDDQEPQILDSSLPQPIALQGENQEASQGAELPANEPSELLPLLNSTRRSTHGSVPDLESAMVVVEEPLRNPFVRAFNFIYSNTYFHSFLFIMFLVGVVITFYFAYRNLDALVAESIQSDIHKVSVLKVDDDGATFHVVGSVLIHYGQINNVFYRNLIKVVGAVLGSVTLTPKDAVKIYAAPKDIQMDPLHVLNVFPPEFDISVVDGTLTEIDFITKADFFDENITKLANSVLGISSTQDEIQFNIKSELQTLITSKLFWVNNDINVYSEYTFQTKELSPVVRLEDLSIGLDREGENEIDVDGKALIDIKLPLKFQINPIEWDASFQDCEGHFVNVGNWYTDSINFLPHKSVSVGINGVISAIPDALLEVCQSDGLSPFNHLVRDAVEHGTLEVYLKASKGSANEKNLPKWLDKILKKVNYKLALLLPKAGDARLDMLETYQLDSFSLEVSDTQFSDPKRGFLSTIESNLSAAVRLPTKILGVEVSVPKLLFGVDIKDEDGKRLARGHSTNYESIRTVGTNKEENIANFLIALNHLEVEVLEPADVGKLVNSVINERLDSDLFLDVTIKEAAIEFPIFNTTLRNLKFSNVVLPHQAIFTSSGFKDSLRGTLNDLNVKVQNIYYVGSTAHELRIMVDCELTNPTNISIDIPRETLTLGVATNSTGFGNFSTTDLFVPHGGSPNERFNLSTFVNFNPESEDDKVSLEYFVSRYISGFNDTKVDIKGVNGSASSNPGLNELVSQISLGNVQLPSLSFEHPEEISSAEDGKVPERRSPFLIDTTIYVWSSEVELTVFNPVSNAELIVEIQTADATYKGELLGHLTHRELVIVPPGVSKTPRFPMKINNGIGMDILKKAIDGELSVDVLAAFDVRLDKFSMELLYSGAGMQSKIRL